MPNRIHKPSHGAGPNAEGGPRRNTALLCRDFLKALSHAAKLSTLYSPTHPVPAAALHEAWELLKRAHGEFSGRDVTIALVEGRWLVNDAAVADTAKLPEALAGVFEAHGVRGLTFGRDVRLFELTAFCKLASLQPAEAGYTDVGSFLEQRGVKHIRVSMAEYTSRPAESPEAPPVVSPIPAAAVRPEAAAPVPHRYAGLPFGSFVKKLVDDSVEDPQERAQIYADTLSNVKKALEKHVAEATRKLEAEKQLGLNQLARTERVLSNVADGKVVVDKDGRVLMMDSVAEQIAGKRLAEVAGKPIIENLETGEQMVSLSTDLELSGEQPSDADVRVAGDAEAMEAFRQSMAVVQDEQGHVVGTYAVLPYVAKFKEAMRLQKEFVSHVTHELKAPLSSICSALELVTEMAGSKLKPEERRFLDISLKNSRQLKQMINEILDFSKLQSGKMSVNATAVPAEPIVREAVEGMRPWAILKKLVMEMGGTVFSNDGSLVQADHGRIVQVLTNLISNAIKSTPEGGRLWISATDRDRRFPGQMLFSVRDTGCGIAKQDQEKIFQRFTQVEQPGQRRDGVGLGLAIVKQLIDLHQGTLGLESEAGRGATFYFTLPLPRSRP